MASVEGDIAASTVIAEKTIKIENVGRPLSVYSLALKLIHCGSRQKNVIA